MTKTYSAYQLDELRNMVDEITDSSYSIRVIPTAPAIVELTEHAGERVWLNGQQLINIKVGAEGIMSCEMMVREGGRSARILELTPMTEEQKWPTT